MFNVPVCRLAPTTTMSTTTAATMDGNPSTTGGKPCTKKLVTFFNGEYQLAKSREENDDNSGGSGDSNTNPALSRLVVKIKPYLLVVTFLLALVAFFGFIIATTVHSTRLASLEADQSQHRLFWLSTTELKSPFQQRLIEQLQNETGVGIKTKHFAAHHLAGQCLEVIYNNKWFKANANVNLAIKKTDSTARCNTRFIRFQANRTLHLLKNGFVKECIFAVNPSSSSSSHPIVKSCKEAEGAIGIDLSFVLPSVTAVDFSNNGSGVVYFSLYNVRYPFQCGGIDSQGFLTMELCTGKDNQLFYLDNGPAQYEDELVQLMRTIRSKNLLD